MVIGSNIDVGQLGRGKACAKKGSLGLDLPVLDSSYFWYDLAAVWSIAVGLCDLGLKRTFVMLG